MTSEQRQQIEELFDAASELPPGERSSFLSGACHGDDDVRAEVEHLLAKYEQMGDFLEQPAVAIAAAQLRETHTFDTNEVLSGRFRIVRFVGRGGMGEVYEAEDLDLGRIIALKAIRPEIAADDRAIARFKQEIRLSLKVNHPNVCRTFDIERHTTAPGSEGFPEEVTYLTMQLLPGETLAERLRRTGRMSTDEALPIVNDIVDGLQAAHSAGIVHGDLKSSNVILVPSDAGTLSAVVTDFGLARLSSAPGDESSGAIGGTGTPAYMAPEQVERGRITPAADIYSLGVVMFEMVTGTLPFVADTPTLIANQRLQANAPPPRSIVSDLDRRWEAAILRCLQRSPLDRFATPADVALALRRRPWLPVRAPQRRAILYGGAALLLLVLSTVGYRTWQASRPEHKAQLAQAQIREGLAHEQKGESKQAEEAFGNARRLYDAAANRAGVAEALADMGNLLDDQADFERAKGAYQAALTITRETGPQKRVGTLLQDIGVVLHHEGDVAGARESYESALTVFRNIDDKRGVAAIFKNLGNIAPTRTEAQKDYEQALAIFKEIGDKPGTATTLDDIGVDLDMDGYLAAARKAFEEELSIWDEVGGQQYTGYRGNGADNLGDVLYEQGALSEARKQFEELLRSGRGLNVLRNLGEVLLQQDQLSEARKTFEEALTLGFELGNHEDVGQARLLIARLSLEENRPSEAEAQAQQAREQFRLQRGVAGEPRTLTVLARALAAQRRFREAKSVLKTQLPRDMKNAPIQSFGPALFVRVTAGRAFGETGNPAAGAKWLKSALADASRLGYLGYQFEARLGLGEIQMKSGHAAEGRSQLASLAKEAHAKGFGLIAREAERVAAGNEVSTE
ncbi:MAG TPA: tetratricopeptide repeat protein [Terriglobia bacterium]|nr:tetratricopeptide repeat protein [Terriglobia bacterium]